MKVEVLIMDIVNFGVISKTEINMKSLFSQIEVVLMRVSGLLILEKIGNHRKNKQSRDGYIRYEE